VRGSVDDNGAQATNGLSARLQTGRKNAARTKALKLTYPDPSEDEFHEAVARLLDLIFAGKNVVWSHFPAGGYLLTPAAAARLYRLGLKRGMPDIMIWFRHPTNQDPCCIGMELKTRTGKATDAQRKKHAALEEVGVPCMICRTFEEVLTFLDYYQVPRKKVKLHGDDTAKASRPAQSSQGARAA
jgi:hypothetical protein